MVTISQDAAKGMREAMDNQTSTGNIPGVVFSSVNKKGEEILNHASGTRGLSTTEPMNLDTVFWMASCTKLINSIAVMQIVEQGKIGLDDADALEKVCPELASIKILKNVSPDGKAEYEEKKNRITLRMLQTHTAGFGYTFFNPALRRVVYPVHFDEFSGYEHDILRQPLVMEPGVSWEYGINVDWAGVVVERISGLKLNAYYTKNIFEPLGITDISMFPNKQMIDRLAFMHQREVDGTLREREHLLRRPLVAPDSEKDSIFNSAGAGTFAKPTDYTKILATLLNDGVSPTTNKAILKKESVDELFKNAIPDLPNFARKPIAASKPEQTNPLPELYPQGESSPQGWNLAGFLNIDQCPTGRGANSTFWAGLANLFWFIDREKGVAGLVATQILPFGDPNVMGLWAQLEIGIFSHLS